MSATVKHVHLVNLYRNAVEKRLLCSLIQPKQNRTFRLFCHVAECGKQGEARSRGNGVRKDKRRSEESEGGEWTRPGTFMLCFFMFICS
ncbi:hypothetical protein ABG768_004924, partial [Culter alburnus]